MQKRLTKIFVAIITMSIFAVDASSLPYFGVNISGAESSGSNMPGVYGQDYIYPTSDELDYFKAQKMMLIRLPFRWERIQSTLNGALDVAEIARIDSFLDDILE